MKSPSAAHIDPYNSNQQLKMALNGGKPECRPIKTLDDILNWKPPDSKLYLPSITLQPRSERMPNVPRTLLCHDMSGGYLDDRFVQGINDQESYRFFHWSHIDCFVYFSHNLITIPPPGWIDAAHLHGVSILGTFITEWKDGEKLCETFLGSEETCQELVEKLVDVAQYFQFDGWLINIENVIQKTQVPQMVKFVQSLTKLIHEKIPGSSIIWYDSVINTGELKWQDELNDNNRLFFDECDGIYLNYNWDEQKLHSSVKNAGQRVQDVYAGIDVFGRGTVGGGGFNTKMALEIVRQYQLSAAIFAQGWVYEKLGKTEFTQNEYKFWGIMTRLFPSYGPTSLPFTTSFCQGFGSNFFQKGKLVHSQPWSNLSLQQYQPTLHSRYQQNVDCHMEIYTADGFYGGGCLCLSGSISQRNIPAFQLLKCSFSLKKPVLISYVWKELEAPSRRIDVCLVAFVSDGHKRQRAVHFPSCSCSQHSAMVSDRANLDRCIQDEELNQPAISLQDDKIEIKNDFSFDKYDVETDGDTKLMDNNWKKRMFLLEPRSEEETINYLALEILTSADSFKVLLGQLQVVPVEDALTMMSPSSLSVSCLHVETTKEDTMMSISCLLQWTGGNKMLVDHYLIFCQLKWGSSIHTVYVDATRKTQYKVTELLLPNPRLAKHSVRFIVQEQLIEGPVASLKDAPSVEINF